MYIGTQFFYRDVLKVYNEDCILYDTNLYGTSYDLGAIKPEGISDGKVTVFCWEVWFGTIIVWALCCLATWDQKKIKWKWVTWLTVPLQFGMTIVLILVTLTLTNGDEGIRMYLYGEDTRLAQ